MKYSVLMSVYFGEKSEFLHESLKSMLAQTVPTDDFILVCDGQLTSELDKVITHYESKYSDVFHVIRLIENLGLAEALNSGLPHCKHEWVARMDSDDISTPHRIERLMQLQKETDADIVGSSVYEFEENIGDTGITRSPPSDHESIIYFARRRNPFNHPSVMFKKSAVLNVGGYEKYPLFEDYHLWIKMLQAGYIAANAPEPLLHMRTGNGMHKRRGGMSYFRTMLRFRAWMKSTGYINSYDFAVCVLIHGLSCLLPNHIRRWLYNGFLRKRVSG